VFYDIQQWIELDGRCDGVIHYGPGMQDLDEVLVHQGGAECNITSVDGIERLLLLTR
jgi:hypothetical protein